MSGLCSTYLLLSLLIVGLATYWYLGFYTGVDLALQLLLLFFLFLKRWLQSDFWAPRYLSEYFEILDDCFDCFWGRYFILSMDVGKGLFWTMGWFECPPTLTIVIIFGTFSMGCFNNNKIVKILKNFVMRYLL